MGSALESKNKSQILKNIDAYVECSQFISIGRTRDGMYKLYPRVKDRVVFNACVKQKGADISDNWVKEVKKE